jgi:predicted MFS family arabinose efflux permease
VDFVARGLGQGIHAGARYWVLFGLGAVAGPVLAGLLADRVGFGPALRLALVIQAVAVALPIVTVDALGLAVSSLVVGAAVPGIVPLVLGRVQELVPDDAERQRAAWSVTTMAFALGQAAGAYGLSFLFARGGHYTTLFAVGAAALTLALAIDLGARLAGRKPI